jgi:hypothetical protein
MMRNEVVRFSESGASRVNKWPWVGAALLALACAPALKVPSKVARQPAQGVERHAWTLKLGGGAVSDVARGSDRVTGRGLWTFKERPSEASLRFVFRRGSVALDGDCLERVNKPVMGFVPDNVSLTCTCRQAGKTSARLTLEKGKGSAQLEGGAAYEVSALNRSTRNKKEPQALGYWFQRAEGEGAVDVTGDGRFWLPPGLPAQEEPGLLCLYAGLLLYHPSAPL